MAQTFDNGEGLASIRGKLNGNALQINALQRDADLYFDTVKELLDNTSLTYTDVPVGAVIVIRSDGFAYQVAASSAPDSHVTTAGGVELYISAAYRSNVKAFGAKGDNTDDSLAVQSAVNVAIATGTKRVLFPFSGGERYNLGSSTININSSGFELVGDAAPVYTVNLGGYITGTASALFDYGVGSAANASNQLTLIGIAAYTTGLTQTFIKFTQNNNGPHRGVIFRDCCANGFLNIVLFDVPTGSNLAAASCVVENCVYRSNTNVINAVEAVLGLRYVGNQSEQGARITGNINAGVTIADNMLEGQTNPVNIDSAAPSLDFRNNYLEAVSGDYHVRFKGTNQNAVMTVDHNYITIPLSTDVYRFEGSGRINEERHAAIVATRKALLTLKAASVAPESRILGKIYVPTDAGRSGGFCDPLALRTSIPSTAVTSTNLGAVALETPFGRTTQGISVNGFPASYYSLTKTWAVGDIMVAVALVRVRGSGEVPAFYIYNDAYSQPSISMSNSTMIPTNVDEWHIVFSVGVTTVAGTIARFRFGSNNVSAGSSNLEVAAIGVDVIPAADFVTLGSESRAYCRIFNPMSGRQLVSQQAAPAYAVGANPTKAEFDALINAVKAAKVFS